VGLGGENILASKDKSLYIFILYINLYFIEVCYIKYLFLFHRNYLVKKSFSDKNLYSFYESNPNLFFKRISVVLNELFKNHCHHYLFYLVLVIKVLLFIVQCIKYNQKIFLFIIYEIG
jgi:hypothetical protein